MFFYATLCISILSLLYFYFNIKFNYWKNKSVKGPKPELLFGNYRDVALRKKHLGMLYNDIYKKYPDEKVVGLYRMTAPTLLIRDLEIVKQIMIKDFESFPERATQFSKEGLGDNIFHSDFETWKILRNRFSLAFTSTKLKTVFSELVGSGDDFVNYIEEITMKKPEQDVHKEILKYTVSTTMLFAFGFNIDTYKHDNKLFEIIDEKFASAYSNEIDMLFPGILTKCNLSILAEETVKFSHQLVEAAVNQKNTRNGLGNIMDIILNLKKEGEIYTPNKNNNNNKETFTTVTEDLLAAQAWIFYTAGYANNTLLITYALYHLAHNVDVQEKLSHEIKEITNKHDRKLSYESLKEMKYLDMVFEEALRMHPLTNGLVRSVIKDTKLEGTDITVSKGSSVVVSPYAIQRDEKYYPEPEKFMPERFLPENNANRHPYAFLPFGTGRRSCMGTQIARIQFKICLAKLLLKFRVEASKNTISNIQYDPYRMLLTPKEKIYLSFLPRGTTLTN